MAFRFKISESAVKKYKKTHTVKGNIYHFVCIEDTFSVCFGKTELNTKKGNNEACNAESVEDSSLFLCDFCGSYKPSEQIVAKIFIAVIKF